MSLRALLISLAICTIPGTLWAQDDESTPAETEISEAPEDAETTDQPETPRAVPKRPLGQAMDAMREGNWAAARITARGDGPVAQDVILWHYLRAGRGDPAMVMAFLDRNPDWPGLPYLREKSEATMSSAPHVDILRFFEDHVPQTPSGAIALARAFGADGKTDLARDVIRTAWLSMPLSAAERDAIETEYAPVVAGFEDERLDMALWKRWAKNATAMLPKMSEGRQALAQARLSLQALAGDVDTKIAAVPEDLADDPGLAHDRFEWRMRKGRTDDAVELLLERSVTAEALGRPEAWATRRRQLARDVMRDGEGTKAYLIASQHYLTEGPDFADLEWLSGFLALRMLGEPKAAIGHFEAFRNAVTSPISLGRAGYWLGRAHEAAGNTEAAAQAYALGAEYQTSFYGLLAAERGNLPIDLTLAGHEVFPPWRDADFTQSSVFHAAVLLLASGELSLSERFFTHLAETLSYEELGQLGQMLEEIEQPHIQVMVGKRAAQYGIEVPGPYYALHPVAEMDHPVPDEIVLAIARRESEFDPGVVSGVGARGLMQVMPATAQAVAGWLDLPYSERRLLTDWEYNATLGAAYLASLSERFDGNVVFMAAGYNAGPGRPVQWAQRFGDPRRGEIDIIDWIELIPFSETRNYIMRVAESLPVYRARLGRQPHPVPFSQELTGSTLLARAPKGE